MQWFMEGVGFFEASHSKGTDSVVVSGLVEGQNIRAYLSGEAATRFREQVISATPEGMSPAGAGHMISVSGMLRRSGQGAVYIQASSLVLVQGAALELFRLGKAAQELLATEPGQDRDARIAALLSRMAPPSSSLDFVEPEQAVDNADKTDNKADAPPDIPIVTPPASDTQAHLSQNETRASIISSAAEMTATGVMDAQSTEPSLGEPSVGTALDEEAAAHADAPTLDVTEEKPSLVDIEGRAEQDDAHPVEKEDVDASLHNPLVTAPSEVPEQNGDNPQAAETLSMIASEPEPDTKIEVVTDISGAVEERRRVESTEGERGEEIIEVSADAFDDGDIDALIASSSDDEPEEKAETPVSTGAPNPVTPVDDMEIIPRFGVRPNAFRDNFPAEKPFVEPSPTPKVQAKAAAQPAPAPALPMSEEPVLAALGRAVPVTTAPRALPPFMRKK